MAFARCLWRALVLGAITLVALEERGRAARFNAGGFPSGR
ncbi:hypothetical protein AKJ09_10635 [Labilithrix luteola]|uniref:Uncharacterized protein n=1 Tax=Labilithrix luteola TaxID=1391654 RepID=A0A0K1QE77_9BACT|nr:hypothetical protein AKJ09_10635 [Labilithrix luteola]